MAQLKPTTLKPKVRSKAVKQAEKAVFYKAKTRAINSKRSYQKSRGRQLDRKRAVTRGKQDAKMAELEARVALAKQEPAKAAASYKMELELKKIKAQSAAKAASAGAYAAAGSTVLETVRQEQNSDDRRNREHEQDLVGTIFGKSESTDSISGLSELVY